MVDNLLPSKDLCSGLRYLNEGSRWRLEADNVGVLRRLLGDEVLAGLARCFAVADRLMSIADLMSLNYAHVGGDTVRGERNLNTLGVFASGLIYELAEALEHLETTANIRACLSPEGIARWERLARFASLEHRSVASKIRNLLAFHSGDLRTVRRGLRELEPQAERRLQLIAGDGVERISGRHDFAADIIMAGIRVVADATLPEDDPNRYRTLSDEDLMNAYTEARDGHLIVLRYLDDVLLDAIRQAGADLDPLSPIEPSS